MSDQPEASFLAVTEFDRDMGRALSCAIMVHFARAMVRNEDPDKVTDTLTTILARCIAAARNKEELLPALVSQFGIGVIRDDLNQTKGILSLDAVLSQEDIRHLLTLKDDRSAVEVFLRTRPKVIEAIKASMPPDCRMEDVVTAILTGINHVELPDE